MSETITGFSYTIVSFEGVTADPVHPGIWALVQKLAIECTTLVVDRPADELALMPSRPSLHPARLQERVEKTVREIGIRTRLQISTFEDALIRLQSAHATDVNVILQPHHPLDRQSPGFRRLSRAAYEAKGATVYVPEQASISGDFILLADQNISEAALSLARSLSQKSGLALDIVRNIDSLDALKNKLLSLSPAARPALVITDISGQKIRPVELMKLAAVTSVAVLSYRN